MSPEIDFTAAEWAALRELPYALILAAIVSDADGVVRKETGVAAHQLVADAKHHLDNPLILRVVTDMSNGESTSGNRDVDLKDESARSSAMEQALAASAAAAALLTRAASDQAEGYKQWVYNAADAATRATKSGGFLGIGDKQISDAEAEFLSRLRVNLAMPEGG